MALCKKKSKKAWIWLAVDSANTSIIDFAIGTRGVSTGRKLWNKIKHYDCSNYATDYWEPYEAFIPKSKHLQTKAETYTVEGVNNLLRHFIARFHRKTHCYSKSLAMIENTLLLFIHRKLALSILG